MAIKLIINADDLGLSHEVNLTIDKALDAGAITSSTILANSEYLTEVKTMVDQYPEASFGIHLNMTEGKALTNHQRFQKLGMVDGMGCFLKENSKKHGPYNRELKKIIFEEWQAQILRLESIGIHPTHIDGHHHVHTWYGLETVLLKLMKTYHIRKNRNQYLLPIGLKKIVPFSTKKIATRVSQNTSNPKMVVQDIPLSKKIRSEFTKLKWVWSMSLKGAKMTRFFNSYEGMCSYIESGNRLPVNCTIELMCHPGHPNYLKEMEMVTNHKIQTLIQTSTQLISYKTL